MRTDRGADHVRPKEVEAICSVRPVGEPPQLGPGAPQPPQEYMTKIVGSSLGFVLGANTAVGLPALPESERLPTRCRMGPHVCPPEVLRR
jgi:hypothetical protein